MSKYRLIKKYPCLPDTWYVGITVTKKYDSVYSTDASGVFCVNLCKEQVENYPEFWEKVVEKDYEILSFKQDLLQDLWTKFGNGWGRNINGYCVSAPYTITEILRNPLYKIHSVKRLSDYAVFTVGDKTSDGIITKFEILDGVLIVFISDVTWIKLNLLQKVKKPFFKTKDGVDIYDGDRYYYICNYNISTRIAREGNYKNLVDYYFSTKETAEEYVLMNKPCLSLKDVFDEGNIFCLNEWEKRLKDLVKSKLK